MLTASLIMAALCLMHTCRVRTRTKTETCTYATQKSLFVSLREDHYIIVPVGFTAALLTEQPPFTLPQTSIGVLAIKSVSQLSKA